MADDSAETTATNKRGSTKRIKKIGVERKPDPDALIWDEINASLKSVFDILGKDQSCLLLCSGKSDFCRISLVPLGNDRGPVERWNSIREAAYALRARWIWPSSCGKPRLELVEVSFLALLVLGQSRIATDILHRSDCWRSIPPTREICVVFAKLWTSILGLGN